MRIDACASLGDSMKNNALSKQLGICLLSVIMLTACNKPGNSGQVLAKVGDAELTVNQLNAELASLPQPSKAVAMENLVSRQLLVNAAVGKKLDQDPGVQMQIQRARDAVLSQAYIQQLVSEPPKVTDAEVNDFYQQNPAKFAQRTEFQFQQLVLESDNVDEGLQKTVQSGSWDEVSSYLLQHGLKYQRQMVWKSSAELPAELLEKIRNMQPGILFTVKEPKLTIVAVIRNKYNDPVEISDAKETIRRVLEQKKVQETLTTHLQQLKDAAKVSYTEQAKSLK